MEMGRRSGNGGGKVVTFDDAIAIAGMRRNGSLSSYLDMGVREAADGGHAAAPRPLPAHGMGSRRRTYADGELDVFSAERYFRGAMDGDGDSKKGAIVNPTVAAPVEPLVEKTRPAAAVVMAKPPSSTRASTVSSVSSANSQTALFRGRRRRSGDNNKCCVHVGVLMRTCSGKRAVRVDDGCAVNKEKEAPDAAAAATGIDWYRELRMHKAAIGLSGDGNSHGGGLVTAAALPPSLNLGTAKVAAIGREEKEAAELTFSSSAGRRSNFTLVAPVAVSGRVVGEPGGGGAHHHLHDDQEEDDDDDDGAGSESSSDLFEIKSLMIGDCPYEPSEASVQWSVVTASAADNASERGDRVPAARWAAAGGGGGGGARGPDAGKQHRRPPGLLVGCTSHRAVDVSAATTTTAVPNTVAAMQRRRTEGFQKARNGARRSSSACV